MHSTLDTVQQHLDRIEERIQLISLLYCVKQLVTFVMPPWLPPDCEVFVVKCLHIALFLA